jgi:biotin carboxyl carrier protein
MENELRAPTDGTVVEVLVEAGASVEKDQLLVMLGDEPPMPTAD